MSEEKAGGILEGTFEEEPRPKETALAVAKEETQALDKPIENQKDLVAALDEELKEPGAQQKILSAIMKAANALAPIFSVTSVPLGNGGERQQVLSSDIIIEILCSAGSWLAHAKGISKAELLEKFEGWMKDSGYE